MRLFLATPFWVLTYVFIYASHLVRVLAILSHLGYECAAFTTVAIANGWGEAVKQLSERGN